MEEMRQIVIAMLAVGGIGTAAVAAQEIVQAVAERRRRAEALREVRARDMEARAERIKRERIAECRRQLWLEYAADKREDTAR